MAVFAAFYKKKGNWWDSIIRWRTSSIYSHCELVIAPPQQSASLPIFYSSSPRDGGVRSKVMPMLDSDWDFIPLPWVEESHVRAHYELTKGSRYDWLGVLIGQGLTIKVHWITAWFCSEWCAATAELSEPWRYSPGTLYNAFKDAHELYSRKDGL